MQSMKSSLGDAGALGSLLAARPAFGTSTEAESLFQLTERHLRPGVVNWLEVGAGDGRHLLSQVRRLSASREMRVVAIDPEEAIPLMPAGITWLRSRLEDYRPDRQFDWINMRHSGYYVCDLAAQIGRMTNSLSAVGTLALTHWSRDCVLRRLHVRICGERDDLPVAGIEDLGAVLASNLHLTVSAFEQHETDLLVHEITASPAVASAVYSLARRGRPPQRPNHDPVDFIADCLRDLPASATRRNGVMMVRQRR